MDDKTKDKYLLRKYGITLKEYKEELALHNGVCQICGKPPGKRSLHVDHDHGYKYVKIEYTKVRHIWAGLAKYRGYEIRFSRKKKREVTRFIREQLKRHSWRGIICFPCNRTLRSANNSSQVMRRAADYLERFYYPTAVQPPNISGENNEKS